MMGINTLDADEVPKYFSKGILISDPLYETRPRYWNYTFIKFCFNCKKVPFHNSCSDECEIPEFQHIKIRKPFSRKDFKLLYYLLILGLIGYIAGQSDLIYYVTYTSILFLVAIWISHRYSFTFDSNRYELRLGWKSYSGRWADRFVFFLLPNPSNVTGFGLFTGKKNIIIDDLVPPIKSEKYLEVVNFLRSISLVFSSNQSFHLYLGRLASIGLNQITVFDTKSKQLDDVIHSEIEDIVTTAQNEFANFYFDFKGANSHIFIKFVAFLCFFGFLVVFSYQIQVYVVSYYYSILAMVLLLIISIRLYLLVKNKLGLFFPLWFVSIDNSSNFVHVFVANQVSINNKSGFFASLNEFLVEITKLQTKKFRRKKYLIKLQQTSQKDEFRLELLESNQFLRFLVNQNFIGVKHFFEKLLYPTVEQPDL
jgi:hypothetical protein